jgi:segregation and condensation protein B
MDEEYEHNPESEDFSEQSFYPDFDASELEPELADVPSEQALDKVPAEAEKEQVQEPVLEDIPGFTPDPEALIKAMIFASSDYVNLNALKEIMGRNWDAVKIRETVRNINEKLEHNNEPFEIVEVSGSFRFRTRTQYYPWVKKLFKEAGTRKLSQAALEILSLVAYKQPITKAEIEDIRGVTVDGVLKGLLERRLIAITGKTDKIGGAYTYGTSKEFLRYFNINRVPQDLPKLSEFEDLINSTALLPQISSDGTVVEAELDETEGDPEN